MNPLYQIRKDLKPIIEAKKWLDYDNQFGGKTEEDKSELNTACKSIKKMIIELGNKYKEERSE